MLHFTQDDTHGYSDWQLERANDIVDAWCGLYEFNPADAAAEMLDAYKAEKERALAQVEADFQDA